MGRPSKTVDSREAILVSARKLLLLQGHGALSLRAVAADADFSPASLYEYFDGKDALLAAVAAEAMAKFHSALAEASNTVKNPGKRLVALGLAYVAFASRHEEDFLLLFSRLGSKRSSLAEAVPESSVYGVLVAALKAAKPRASQLVVEHCAYAFWATVHGMAMLQLTHLRAFNADFVAADRQALQAIVDSLQLGGTQ